MPAAAYWTPTRIVEDTRLPAQATGASRYVFGASGNANVRVEARLIFRRAYYELMRQKDWETADILMEHEVVSLVRDNS